MGIEKKLEYAVHPGIIMKDFLKNLGMKQKDLASRINVKESVISEIITGKRNITADFAIKLESVFEIPANFWTGLQADYDVYVCREHEIITTEKVVVNTEIRKPTQYSLTTSLYYAA